MSHFAIAGLQLSLPNGDNLSATRAEIIKTKKRFPWVEMIVLSELCTYGPEKKYACSLPSDFEAHYCQLAKELDIWLIPGSHYEQAEEGIYNTTTVINNQGEIVKRYRKIYPFYPYETGILEGKDFVVFDVPQGRIGVAICYDLWFPEVARQLISMGAEAIVYPTLTGTIDRSVELAMATATAATNQCYVIAVNAGGKAAVGQSIVVGPEGDTLYLAGVGTEIFPVEIDFARVRRTRERGLLGLGQPVKSFRDNKISYPCYQQDQQTDRLQQLGALTLPNSNSSETKSGPIKQ